MNNNEENLQNNNLPEEQTQMPSPQPIDERIQEQVVPETNPEVVSEKTLEEELLPQSQDAETSKQTYEQNRNDQLRTKPKTTYKEHNKLNMLVSLSLILAVASIISIFLVLRMKNKATNENIMDNKEETDQSTVTESSASEDYTTDENELNLQMKISELDKLGLDKIENDYSNNTLEY